MSTYRAIDIASYIIKYSNEIGSPVDNLKLQKLLYYSQAAVLVELKRKCFEEPIIAWKFGPVVPDVYQRYKEYGRNEIQELDENKMMRFDDKKMKIVYESAKEINAVIKKIINRVVDSYAKVSNPFELVRKTHEEDPWKNADLNQEIVPKMIYQYYLKYPKKIYGV